MASPVAVGWLYFARIGLLACLWAGVGMAVRVMWRDLRPPPASSRPTPPAPPATITVKSAPDTTGLYVGASHVVHEELTFGRSPGCTIPIDDPFASAVHARIVWRAPDFMLEDMGSSNGTHVGEERLPSARPLHDGDEVRIGSVSFVFRLA